MTGSDGRPVSKEYGPYEYYLILQKFESDGFAVISGIRQNDERPEENSRKVVDQILLLRKAGVPAKNITVVGASAGGIIAAHVSATLEEPNLSCVLIAGLFDIESERGLVLHGRVLSIHDQSDVFRVMPEYYFKRSHLAESRAIVTATGLGHGLLFTPHPAWYVPAKKWALFEKDESNQALLPSRL